MRTQNIKFLRTDKGRLFMFRYGGGSIYSKILVKGVPSSSVKVAEGVSPVFSVWNSDSMVYLICLSAGGVTLCLYRDGKWVSRILSGKTEDEFSSISFLSSGDTLHLVYSLDQGVSHSLCIRSAKGDRWMAPVKIDDVIPFGETPFYIGRESRSTVRLYYRTTDRDIKFRIFDLTNGSISPCMDLISANMPCTDISVLTEKNESHILYLVKGPFSSQLIYKGINGTSPSKAKIIWEGQLSGSCSLLKNDGRLYALIYDRTKCFAAFSDDGGNSFSAAKNLGVRMGDSCRKAEYTDFFENTFLADEIPTDISDFTFPVSSDIFPAFIPSEGIEERPAVRQMSAPASPQFRVPEGNINELNEKIKELNSLLNRRNDEIAAITASWKAKYDALLRENSALKEMKNNGLSHGCLSASNDTASDVADISGSQEE